MTKDRKSECSYQMTMDGPTANMKFLQEFSAKFMNENYHSLVDSGTCSRHIVHGAFGTGARKSGWVLKKLLKGAYMIVCISLAYTSVCKLFWYLVFWRKKNCIFTHFLEKWYSFQKQNSGKLWESVFFYNSNVHCTH